MRSSQLDFGRRFQMQSSEVRYSGQRLLDALGDAPSRPWYERLRRLVAQPEVEPRQASEWWWLGFRCTLGRLPSVECADAAVEVPAASDYGLSVWRSDDDRFGFLATRDLALRFSLPGVRVFALEPGVPARGAGGYEFAVRGHAPRGELESRCSVSARIDTGLVYAPPVTLDLLRGLLHLASFFGTRLGYDPVSDV